MALVLLHRATTLYLGATSFVYLGLQYLTTKKLNTKLILVWIISVCGGLILYGPLFPRLITNFLHPLVTTFGGDGIQGDFFSLKEFWWFTMFLIAPTLYGVYLKIKNKEYDMIFSGLLLGLLRTSCGLLNAKRIELFLDLFMILMSGYAIRHIIKQKKRRLRVLLYLGLFLQILYYIGYSSENNTPQIGTGEFASIRSLKDIVPANGIVVVTDSYLSPWVLGYADRDRIAP